nr:hypothetical protein [Tanacetum cinerariifolium]
MNTRIKAGSGSKILSNNLTIKLNLSKFQSLRIISAQRSKPNPPNANSKSPGTYCVNFPKFVKRTEVAKRSKFKYSDVHQRSKEISIDELKIMMQSYFERMNQQREHETLFAAQREQELREQEQAAQEKEEPPQNSDFHQLIREICGTKVCGEQKKNMEDTMLELLEVCRQKELYCMHNNVDDLIESALDSKLLSINLKSQRLDKEKQEVKNIVE